MGALQPRSSDDGEHSRIEHDMDKDFDGVDGIVRAESHEARCRRTQKQLFAIIEREAGFHGATLRDYWNVCARQHQRCPVCLKECIRELEGALRPSSRLHLVSEGGRVIGALCVYCANRAKLPEESLLRWERENLAAFRAGVQP